MGARKATTRVRRRDSRQNAQAQRMSLTLSSLWQRGGGGGRRPPAAPRAQRWDENLGAGEGGTGVQPGREMSRNDVEICEPCLARSGRLFTLTEVCLGTSVGLRPGALDHKVPDLLDAPEAHDSVVDVS